jgi:tetratricopeptide (TPR) repeat protein
MTSPHLTERLIREAISLRRHDADRACELLAGAVEVARRIRFLRFGARLRQGLLSKAEAHLANTLRLRGQLQAAAEIWPRIWERVGSWPVEPSLRAELLRLEASLRTDLRELEKARGLLAEAEAIARENGDATGLARVLIKQGNVADHLGETQHAVELYLEAARILDPAAEPELALMTRHNLANRLVDLGRLDEASFILAANRSLYARCVDPEIQLRRSWARARLLRARGRPAAAANRLARLRTLALSRGRVYSAAVIGVDLAEALLAAGRTGEVKDLAHRLTALFESQQVHDEARAALALFQRAALADGLTAAFLIRLRRYLVLAEGDPRLSFATLGSSEEFP